MASTIDESLKALAATLDDIELQLRQAESAVAAHNVSRDVLLKARDQIIRTIEALQGLKGR